MYGLRIRCVIKWKRLLQRFQQYYGIEGVVVVREFFWCFRIDFERLRLDDGVNVQSFRWRVGYYYEVVSLMGGGFVLGYKYRGELVMEDFCGGVFGFYLVVTWVFIQLGRDVVLFQVIFLVVLQGVSGLLKGRFYGQFLFEYFISRSNCRWSSFRVFWVRIFII